MFENLLYIYNEWNICIYYKIVLFYVYKMYMILIDIKN